MWTAPYCETVLQICPSKRRHLIWSGAGNTGPCRDLLQNIYRLVICSLLPNWEHGILWEVRIIARSTLDRFVNNRVNRQFRTGVKKHLDAWYGEVEKALWKDTAELMVQFRSASIISSEKVVFNIKGNEYRLVVAINYYYRILLIIWLGTHKEYDKIDAKKVAYKKERYANSSNSN